MLNHEKHNVVTTRVHELTKSGFRHESVLWDRAVRLSVRPSPLSFSQQGDVCKSVLITVNSQQSKRAFVAIFLS